MKVILFNGSPHANGSTYTALSEIAKRLETHGIDSEIVHIGTKPVAGCIGCNACRKSGIDPENALELTNKKFINRFNHLEKRVAEQGKMVSETPLEELESYWQEAKKN